MLVLTLLGYEDKGKGDDETMTDTDRAKAPKVSKAIEDYIPDGIEQKMLEVLLDPCHRMASVKKQCELMGISRQTYYTRMKNKEFMDYYIHMCRENMRQRAGELMNIGIREARKGGPGAFQYWKEIAKMIGIVDNDKMNVEVEGDMEITVRFAAPGERDA